MPSSAAKKTVVLGLLTLLWGCAAGLGLAAPEANKADIPRIGRIIPIKLPIDNQTDTHVRRLVNRALEKAQNEKARLVVILQFDVPAAAGDGGGSSFSDAYKLADFLSGKELSGTTTVAYIPKTIRGHAVLVALACDEIIMADDASIGAAGAGNEGEAIGPTVLTAYREIANRHRTVPVELALGMLDKSREVLQVETKEIGTQFVTPDQLDELGKKHTISSQKTLIPAGQFGQFTGAEARRLGFVRYLAAGRREAVRALDLPPEAVEEDLSLDEPWRAVRVNLKGPITEESAAQTQRLIEDEIHQHGANFICLWIDTPGGSAVGSMNLANYLAELDPSRVRTVAYIPNECRADAILPALACDQVVMHDRSYLGGSGARVLTDEQIQQIRQTIRVALAPKKLRSWSLWAAMIDPRLDVYECARLGEKEYFSGEELEEANQELARRHQNKWEKVQRVTNPGSPFHANGTQAVEYHLATRKVDNFAAFKQYYGLENDPALLEPGWADFLVEALASPGVAVLLLMIGGFALYFELHTPGMGIGAFVATVCFLLFFWSRYLGGTAGWLEITLFLAGLSCLLLEVFVIPGFGIFGLGGGALILASLVLASQTFFLPRNDYQFAQLERSLLSIGGAVLGVVVAAVLLRRWIPRSRLFSRMFLEPPSGEEAEGIRRREALVDFADLLGARGTATTPLMPSGKARIGNRLVNVTAENEVLERGAAIEVVEVRGNRVVVRAAEPGS